MGRNGEAAKPWFVELEGALLSEIPHQAGTSHVMCQPSVCAAQAFTQEKLSQKLIDSRSSAFSVQNTLPPLKQTQNQNQQNKQ